MVVVGAQVLALNLGAFRHCSFSFWGTFWDVGKTLRSISRLIFGAIFW